MLITNKQCQLFMYISPYCFTSFKLSKSNQDTWKTNPWSHCTQPWSLSVPIKHPTASHMQFLSHFFTFTVTDSKAHFLLCHNKVPFTCYLPFKVPAFIDHAWPTLYSYNATSSDDKIQYVFLCCKITSTWERFPEVRAFDVVSLSE
jgi:hypothetical protein